MPARVFSIRRSVQILGPLTLLGRPVRMRYLIRKINKEIADCLAREALSTSIRLTNEAWLLLLFIARENFDGNMACSRRLGEIRGLDPELLGRYLSVLAGEGLITKSHCPESGTIQCALSSEATLKLLEIYSPKPANDHR